MERLWTLYTLQIREHLRVRESTFELFCWHIPLIKVLETLHHQSFFTNLKVLLT